MTHHIPTSHRNSKTFIASFLTYVLLTSQLTPVAFALNRATVTRSGRQPEVARKAESETPAPGIRVTANAPAPVPVPLAMVPNITATKTDSYPSAPAGAQPGEVITYSVTITNSGTDATNVTLNDTVDPNTTIVGGSAKSTPILFNDSYGVVGNVRIQVPDGVSDLLANDIDPDTGTNAGLTITALAGDVSAPFAGTSTQSGQVTAATGDGSFAYNPAPGFTGTDTFTYTATDSDGNNSTATVTLTITGMIWFVNSAAGAGGDGRLTTPFNCLVGAGCFDPVAADDPGDNIFLYSGSYTGGLTFLANQKLIGQAASATLASIAGVTVPTFSDALPSTGGASPVITTAIAATNALNVSAGGITLRGFTVGNTTGAKILGSNFGTLTAGNNTSPDLVLNGSGQALNLTTGTFAATSAFLSVATTSSGTQGISLAGVAGTVSFGSTTVSGATTQGILVGTTTANIAFGNTSVTGGTDGVSLQNNSSGTRTFGTLSVSGNSGVGFLHAIGGGATTVTGATTITNPTGIGIDVDGSNADLSFAATTVNKGSTANIGVDLTNNATRTIGFTSLTVTTTNAFALNTNNSGTVNAGAGALTQSGAGGGAASLTNTALGLTFTSISSDGGGNGIIISGGSGTLTSGTTNLQNNAGIGLLMSSSAVVANFGNTTVNSSAGDGVDLSTNTGAITFADLDITPDANLRGLDALNDTGTITSTSGDIATTGAPAINISGPAGRTPLAMVLTNVDSTNSTTLGVDINLVSGNLTVNDAGVATNITNPTGVGIQVRNTASGTMNFGNTNVSGSGGTGVVLGTAGNGNAGAITFADLDIAPDSGQRALQATVNTGALTASSGTVTTTNNTAVEISGTSNASRTPLNFRLTTVAVTGGGTAPNGIKLLNTSATGSPGGFRVLGNGGTCTNATPTCTGGQIANTTGADGATGGAAIRLDNVDTAVFTRMRLNDHVNYAIRGINVNGFTLDTSVAHGVIGSNEGAPHSEGAINFDGTGSGFPGLSGSSAITNSDIRGGRLDNLRIDNSSGTLNLTISGSTFRETSAAVGSDNIFIEVDTSATAFISVTGSTFASTGGDHINLSLLNNAIGHLTFTGNTLTGGHAIGLGQGIFVFGATWDGTCRYNISNNVMSGTRQGHAIHTNKGSGTGTMDGTISGNTIGITGVAESGASESSGITVASRGTGGVHTAVVSNNTIRQFDEFGINLEVGEDGGAIPSSSATLNVTITGNNISEPGPNALHGIHLNSGILVTDDNTSCADIGGAGALSNNVPNAANEVNGGSDIRPRQRQGTRINMPGYGGTAFDNTAVNAYFTGRNSLTTVAASSNNNGSTANDGFFNTPGGAPCAQPTAPTLPSAPETAISATDETGATGTAGASASLTAPTNTDSITSRPFISSPRQQPTVTGGAAVMQTVAAKPQPAPAPVQPPTTVDEPSANPPVIVGDNLTWDVGTLPAGQSVTITFQVTVDNPFMGAMAQVSNQGTVSLGGGGGPVLTDDPSVGGMNDPTVTPIAAPPDLFVRDARVAEPSSGSTSMLFTLALSSPAPTGGIVVNLSTANGTANGGTCVAGDDYETVSGGTATFAVGEQIKTFPVTVCSDATVEGDETLFLNVNSAPGATIVDGQGLGTITANVPGTTLISELRTSGPGGAGDDFVEIYNNTDTPHTVPAGGYGLFKRGPSCDAVPVLVGTIPAATVIPQRGHYLFVGSTYSLGAYATGNATLTTDIESDFNVGLFSTVDPLSISTANRLDAVGFIGSAGGICDVLREGTALPQALGSTSEYSFVREFTLVSNDVPTPTDGNDNAADFTVVSTTPSTPVGSTAAPRLGAPGPENLAGPNWKKFSQVGSQLIDPTLSASVAPNRARDTTPDPGNNSTLGTLASRRTFTNNTGAPITRLRFRVYDITTFPSPVGTADLRVRTSTNAVVTVTGVGSVTALATTLETPPAQPNSGGLNSSVAAGTVTLGTPLANGASIHLNFLFGVQQGGSFRVFVFVEAVP